MQETPVHTPVDDDIALAQSGDRLAFGRVMDAYLPMAYRVAYRLLGSADDAQDACQDAFLRVWQHFPSYDRTRPFTTWLYAIVTRLSLDRLRRRQRFSVWFLTGEKGHERAENSSDRNSGVVRAAEWKELSALVVRLAGRLPPTQRIVFALRDLEDLDVEEVVEVTGLSRSSVKANLSYARRRIREILVREYRVEDAF